MEKKGTPKFVGFFIIVCLVVGIIITVSQMNNQTLSGYVGDNNNIITTMEPYSTQNPLPDMQEVTDNTIGLSLHVPSAWTKVIKDGYPTYIEPDTATYVQIIKTGYTPGLSSITEEIIRSDIESIGGSFISFRNEGNMGYTTLYQITKENVIYDCIEINRIDLYNSARIVISSPDDAYKSLVNEINAIADSVQWNPQNPVPDDFMLAYNQFGNFEFAVPMAWDKSIENGEYVARDNITGAEMHVSVTETNTTYENVNQAIFSEYLASGKEGFSVKQFTSDNNLIYCVSTYSVNSFPVYRVDYLLATGAYEYGICFICPTDYYQEIAPMFDKAFSLFRTF